MWEVNDKNGKKLESLFRHRHWALVGVGWKGMLLFLARFWVVCYPTLFSPICSGKVLWAEHLFLCFKFPTKWWIYFMSTVFLCFLSMLRKKSQNRSFLSLHLVATSSLSLSPLFYVFSTFPRHSPEEIHCNLMPSVEVFTPSVEVYFNFHES